MNTLLISLLVTWTDIFEGIGTFSYWIFSGMRALGQGPNVIWWVLIVGGIAYWCMRIAKDRKIAQRNGTYE
jgi:hypothetical protein